MNGRLTPLQRNANPLRTERMQFLLSGCLYCGDFASCADVCFSRERCIYLCSTWLRDFLSCVVEVEGHWRYIIFLSSCLVHLILRCRSNAHHSISLISHTMTKDFHRNDHTTNEESSALPLRASAQMRFITYSQLQMWCMHFFLLYNDVIHGVAANATHQRKMIKRDEKVVSWANREPPERPT